MSELIAVFLLRASQALVLSLPTLLIGMLAAGFLSRAIGRERILRWVSTGSVRDLPRAWLIGMALPVCALASLPVLVTLYRLGVRRASLVTIALSAPLVAPWTLGYMLDRTGWLAMLLLLLSNFILAIGVAWLVGDRASEPAEAPPERSSGLLLLDVLIEAGASLTRRVIALVLLGAVGAGLLAMLISPNAVGHWLIEREWPHAAMVIGAAMLSYVTPQMLALQAGEVVNASTMPGLILPLIGVGAALNLGLLVAATRIMSWRALAKGVAALLVLIIGLSLMSDVLLREPGYFPDDTHAFEDMGRPFHLLDHPQGAIAGWLRRFAPAFGVEAIGAAVVIGLLMSLDWAINRRPRAVPPIPTLWLRLLAGIGVLVVIVSGVYSFYPAPALLAHDIDVSVSELLATRARRDDAESARIETRLRYRLSQVEPALLLRGRPLSSDERQVIEATLTELAHPGTPGGGRLSDEERRLLSLNTRLNRLLTSRI